MKMRYVAWRNLITIFSTLVFLTAVVGKSNLEKLKKAWHLVDISLDGCRPPDFSETEFKKCVSVANGNLLIAKVILGASSISSYTTQVMEYQERLAECKQLIRNSDLAEQNTIIREKITKEYDEYLSMLCADLARKMQVGKTLSGKLGVRIFAKSIALTNCHITYAHHDDPVFLDLWIQTIKMSKSWKPENYINIIGGMDGNDKFAAVEIVYYEPTAGKISLKTGVWPIPAYFDNSYLNRFKEMSFWNCQSRKLTLEMETKFAEEEESATIPKNAFQADVAKNVAIYYEYLEMNGGLLKNDVESIFEYNMKTHSNDYREPKSASTHIDDVSDIFRNLLEFFNVKRKKESVIVFINGTINTAGFFVKTPCGYVSQFSVRTISEERFLYFVGKINEEDKFTVLDMIYLHTGRNIYGVIPTLRQMTEVYNYANANYSNTKAQNFLKKIASGLHINLEKRNKNKESSKKPFLGCGDSAKKGVIDKTAPNLESNTSSSKAGPGFHNGGPKNKSRNDSDFNSSNAKKPVNFRRYGLSRNATLQIPKF